VLRPDLRLTAGTEPLLIVLDNGWDAAPDFATASPRRKPALAEAARDGRPVSLVATAEPQTRAWRRGANEVAGRLGSITPGLICPTARPWPAPARDLCRRSVDGSVDRP
jgi:hypothetical protein